MTSTPPLDTARRALKIALQHAQRLFDRAREDSTEEQRAEGIIDCIGVALGMMDIAEGKVTPVQLTIHDLTDCSIIVQQVSGDKTFSVEILPAIPGHAHSFGADGNPSCGCQWPADMSDKIRRLNEHARSNT